jgi:MoxR-like ATPase
VLTTIGSIDELQVQLDAALYFADRSLATTLFLALRLERPLLLEGEAGVGKTEIAKVLASASGRRLIRLQCYEGLDVHTAVYEWDYSRQMLHIRLMEAAGARDAEAIRRGLFSPAFLHKRPLLEAIAPDDQDEAGAPVLLVDELDRADEEFEAFLLEVLADYQVTVPEIGTIRAVRRPVVVITSNRTREIHDALRRRCLYHWIDYPTFDKELQIVRAKAPRADAILSEHVVAFVQALRREDLYKRPGVAETLDWVQALVALDRRRLDADTVRATLGALLKYQDDIEQVHSGFVERTLATLSRP